MADGEWDVQPGLTNKLIEMVKKIREEYEPCDLQESEKRLSTYDIQILIEEHAGIVNPGVLQKALIDVGFKDVFISDVGFVWPVKVKKVSSPLECAD